jgi:hypothetical protein
MGEGQKNARIAADLHFLSLATRIREGAPFWSFCIASAGLADPGLSGKQDQSAVPGQRLLHRPHRTGQLVIATHKGCSGRPRVTTRHSHRVDRHQPVTAQAAPAPERDSRSAWYCLAVLGARERTSHAAQRRVQAETDNLRSLTAASDSPAARRVGDPAPRRPRDRITLRDERWPGARRPHRHDRAR